MASKRMLSMVLAGWMTLGLATGCGVLGRQALETWDPGPFCGVMAINGMVVEIDPSANPTTWTVSGDERVKLVWPAGYRLDAAPAVVDGEGRVVVRDGGRIDGSGEADGATLRLCHVSGGLTEVP